MKETFDKMLWSAVQEYRNSTLVVDNHHAYGIIRDRVDSYWEQVRMLQEGDDEMNILGGLLGIAMAAQLCAEALGLSPEQMEVDESAKFAEEEAEAAKDELSKLVQEIDGNKETIESLQRGTKRYKLEFDEHKLSGWMKSTEL